MLAARCGGVPFPSRMPHRRSRPRPFRRLTTPALSSRPHRLARMAAAPPPSPARARVFADPWTVSSASRSDTPTSARPLPANHDDDANDSRASVPEPSSPRAGADATSLLHRRLSAGSASAAASRMRLEVSDTFAAPASPPDDDVLSDAAARDEVETTCAETTSASAHRAPDARPRPLPNPRGSSVHRLAPIPARVVRVAAGRDFPGARDFTGARVTRQRSPSRPRPRPRPRPAPVPPSPRTFANAFARWKRARRVRNLRSATRANPPRALAGDVAAYRERVSSLDAALAAAANARAVAESSARDANDRATASETRAALAETELAACRLSRGARCDASLKAAWVARYWRLAYSLGVAPNRRGGRRSSGRDARPTVATTRYVASSTPRPPRPREVSSPCPRFSRGTRARRTTPARSARREKRRGSASGGTSRRVDAEDPRGRDRGGGGAPNDDGHARRGGCPRRARRSETRARRSSRSRGDERRRRRRARRVDSTLPRGGG